MFWYPQAPLKAFQACHRHFLFLKNNMSFLEMTVLVNVFSTFSVFTFGKTPNRRGTQFHAEKCSNFVLNSYLDPIGDQNDVQELLIYCVYLAYVIPV